MRNCCAGALFGASKAGGWCSPTAATTCCIPATSACWNRRARSGDVLILALNSDASVRRMKGPSRPMLSEQERAELAAALEAVDAVTLFDEETPRELIAAVLPDILVKGADWSHFIAGREEVEAAGGQVVTLPLGAGLLHY